MKFLGLSKPVDLSLDVLILLLAGIMMAITGLLLFPVSSGALPYYENGLYGLLLFIFALQMITLGKTPFGDVRRSRLVLFSGLAAAGIGFVTSFVPDVFGPLPRVLIALSFGFGGLVLLLQMLFAPDKMRAWVRYGGIFHTLIFACGTVYTLSIFVGLLVLDQSLMPLRVTAFVVLAFGAAIIFLSVLLEKIYSRYPEGARRWLEDGQIAPDKALILVTGVFMVILGLVLIPVNLGVLPFSGSAQIGLLMVLIAFQMIATGNTPIAAFPRSPLLVLTGFCFAVLGIVSCLIPYILVPLLTVLIGSFNILGGSVNLLRILLPAVGKRAPGSGPVPAILLKLTLTQVTMNIVSIVFGTSMFFSHLIPGGIVGGVLAANGGLLLYLLHLLKEIDGMKMQAQASS